MQAKKHNVINKEAQDKIISILENAEDFYVPVRKIWRDLNLQGYILPSYEEFLKYLKKDSAFEVKDFKEAEFDDEEREEMEKVGFYSGLRVKIRKRIITKDDIKRITLKHARRTIDNLIKAYEVKPPDLPPQQEDELIELMRRTKELKENIEQAFKEES